MEHQYMRNMLDRKMTIAGEFTTLGHKQELDLEDLNYLIENCRRLIAAAEARIETF